VAELPARLTGAALAALRADPRVEHVEPHARVAAFFAPDDPMYEKQWHMAKIGAASAWALSVGRGVTVAVVDTGIACENFGPFTKASDLALTGCVEGVSFVRGTRSNDDHGHGTHVAGTIAAKNDDRGVVGVAPGARLWAVKVLDAEGKGSTSCIIKGVEWVTQQRQNYNGGTGGINFSVANMSLGGGTSPALCTAIANSVAAGVIYTVAAGNQGADAGNSSPANCPEAITVSAMSDLDGLPGKLASSGHCGGTDDHWAGFSNYGSVVDIAAPGFCILSTYPAHPSCGNQPCYGWMNGTSMAAPHVAGAAALFRAAAGYSGSASGPTVVSAMTGAGWTAPQGGPCGFTGDPDPYPEPMLYMAPCSSTTPTPTPVPTLKPPHTPLDCAYDSDCDGWSDAEEIYLGTNPHSHCAATTTPNDEHPNAWPPDFNSDRRVTMADVLSFNQVLGKSDRDPGWNPRWDLNLDGKIALSDVLRLNLDYGTECVP
jgi:subtilisin family serine protease